ncbi:hypothetical protein N7G274_001257 [Stereocaulon virgatum]|uniref:Uncharacterized protein n=1 Tax=Stereocaulon virgatum TaxID=373712 RepID=A0ABR4AQ40_9LECA
MKLLSSLFPPLATLISVALAAQVQFTNGVAASAALPSTSPFLTEPVRTNTSDVGAAAIECVHNRNPFSMRYMVRRQCDGAIQQLPQDDTQGVFHTGGNEDPFRLPIERASENCKVKVELGYGYDEDDGSWAKIIPLALELSRKCAKQIPRMNSLLRSNRAGYVIAGDHAKIRVTILWFQLIAGDNATVTDVTDAYIGGALANTTAPDAVLAA